MTQQQWFKNNLKYVFISGKSYAYRFFVIFTSFNSTKGGIMKIALVTMAGFSIGALIIISAFQLIKVVIQEMVGLATEAWYSPEHH